MRKLLMMVPFLFACAKTDAPKAADPAPAMAAAATPLTEADIAGTWTGNTMGIGSDSVIGKWTQICAGGKCTLIADGTKDSIPSTYMLMGDSVMGSSPSHMDKAMKVNVTESWVVHIKDGKVTGTGMTNLASKPDSVVAKFRVEGTKKM